MDETDFEILKIIDNDCRIPYSQIAMKLNISLRKVSQRLDDLIKSKVIKRFSVQFNYKLLGFKNYSAIIKSANLEINYNSHELLESIPEIHRILYLLNGEVIINFFVKNEVHFDNLLKKITNLGIKISQIDEIDKSLPEALPFSINDWRLISYLLKDSRATKKEISHALEISEKTVNRRLTKMQEMNLIQFVPEIDFGEISGMLIALLSLETNGKSKEIHSKIKSDNTIKYWRTEGEINSSIAFFLYGNNLNKIHAMYKDVISRDYIDKANLKFIIRNWENTKLIEDAILERIHKSYGLIN